MLQLSEYLQPGEHGISIDTDVALWMECIGSSAIDLICGKLWTLLLLMNHNIQSLMNSGGLYITHRDYNTLSTNALLDYWNEYERNTFQSAIMVYGKRHYKLHYTEMDQLCEWVLKQREKMVMVFLAL